MPASSNFKREIRDIDKLKFQLSQNTFLSKVEKELIQSGRAFLAFRNNNATLYYEGRQLCDLPQKLHVREDGGTLYFPPRIYNHYLPVIRSKTLTGAKKVGCLEATYCNKTKGLLDFTSVLPEILDNMDKERDPEAYQVSNFYRFSPMVQKNCSTVILLDIEATFDILGEKRQRIDMVLYNTEERRLLFVEVKRLPDKRLYSNPSTHEPAEILSQLKGYQKTIAIKKDQIIEQYNKVIQYYNYLANKNVPCMNPHTAEDPLLGLLVVECTSVEQSNPAQASNDFKQLCADIQREGYKMYLYGNTKNATPGTLLAIYQTFKK